MYFLFFYYFYKNQEFQLILLDMLLYLQICAKYQVTEVFPLVPVIAIDFFGLNGCLKLSNFKISLFKIFNNYLCNF